MAKILYGECISAGKTSNVRICDLGCQGCEVVLDPMAAPIGGDCALWIGAIGPFPAIVQYRNNGQHAAYFKEPLDHKIVNHFRANG